MTAIVYVTLLLSLFIVDLLAAISPGPNFVLVTQTAIHRTTRHAMAVVAGFVTTNLIWCLAVALGLSALFQIAPWLYTGIKLCGGAYLLYLGITLWRSSAEPQIVSDATSSVGAAFVRGLLTNLSNPKSVVYFGSIFALFMKPGTPVWVQAIAIAIVVTNTVLWYGTIAVLFSRSLVQKMYTTARRTINRLCGAAMIGFGARLLLVRD